MLAAQDSLPFVASTADHCHRSGTEHTPLDVLETAALKQGHDELELAEQLAPKILAVRPAKVLFERAGPDGSDRGDRAVQSGPGIKPLQRLEQVRVDRGARVDRVQQDEGAAVDELYEQATQRLGQIMVLE
jgi:hypothetical protein